MRAEFLKNLSLTEEERSGLSVFRADSPFALLSLLRASKRAKEVFDNCFSTLERAEFIAGELEKLMTLEERETLKQPPKPAGQLGARIGPTRKPRNDK